MSNSSGHRQDINATQATVTTVSVQIQTVTVGKNQMTLAMWKQLHWGKLIHYDYEQRTFSLRGRVWGRVNIHDKDCREEYKAVPHLHLLFQIGNELRHGVVGRTYRDVLFDGDVEAQYLDAVRKAYRELYRELEDSEQLFIAV